MDAERIIKYAEELGGTWDNPFSDGVSAVLRAKGNGKWFGILLQIPQYFFGGAGEETGLNLKCPPELGYLLTQKYPSVRPAYHMNKTHWITVRLDGSVPEEEIFSLMEVALDTVRPKAPKSVAFEK